MSRNSTQQSALSSQHSAISNEESAPRIRPGRGGMGSKRYRIAAMKQAAQEISLEGFSRLASLGEGARPDAGHISRDRRFSQEEMFGLTSQMRRCSASVAANIAEGCGRRGNGEFHKFLQIATGSASELEYHLLLAKDLGFLTAETAEDITSKVQEVKKMLAGLIKRVQAERTLSADR